MLRKGQYFRVATWDEALGVSRVLTQVAPEDLLMLVSTDLSNEGLFAAQPLRPVRLGSAAVDSTARAALPGGPALWSAPLSLPISVARWRRPIL